ncbi:site-specific integrase [Phycicoccus sp. BSK3Z-2]|uniref:Site-specific integrase n=1 Tax=Phycicoccus avicenniae TaxID=2828860 RepID=A0A941I1W8_9MICO|nr:site-specific integrase [Phycicoccus avicenniae]MBR7744454.1 site-specific integrase [Phycicoccus avicenniae]
MASIKKRPDGKYRARYRDAAGKEHARHFGRKVDAQKWIDAQTAALVSGTHVDPRNARMTVGEWCTQWLEGYATRRASTVRQAKVHIGQIEKAFGPVRLGDVRPSQVKAWTAALKAEGLSDSYVYATYRRFAQIMGDAAHDGLIPRSPCSRRTSPGQGSQRPYVATTDQVWALHDAVDEDFRPAILLGAFAGLRTSEVSALRVEDVDFMRGVVSPEVQWPSEPLKSETSRTPVPIPQELALTLSSAVARHGGATVVADLAGRPLGPWALERAVRRARKRVEGMPEGFRFHDLRHYFASLLIGSGADVKVVQRRLRHASAMTTLNTYGHMWPDADESARAAVAKVLAARADSVTDRVAD